MKFISFVILSLMLPISLIAQTAYSTLDIGIQTNLNINTNRFHEFWRVEPVPEIYAATPIPIGFLKAGISLNNYHGSPDYKAYYPYLSWSLQFPRSALISWINAVKVGSYEMRFGDYETNETKTQESELGIIVSTGLVIHLYRQFYLNTSLDYFRVYTRRTIELTYISAGFFYRLAMPAWFRKWLK
jgi:hypothetical protein